MINVTPGDLLSTRPVQAFRNDATALPVARDRSGKGGPGWQVSHLLPVALRTALYRRIERRALLAEIKRLHDLSPRFLDDIGVYSDLATAGQASSDATPGSAWRRDLARAGW